MSYFVVMKVSPSISLRLIQHTDPHSKTIFVNNPWAGKWKRDVRHKIDRDEPWWIKLRIIRQFDTKMNDVQIIILFHPIAFRHESLLEHKHNIWPDLIQKRETKVRAYTIVSHLFSANHRCYKYDALSHTLSCRSWPVLLSMDVRKLVRKIKLISERSERYGKFKSENTWD